MSSNPANLFDPFGPVGKRPKTGGRRKGTPNNTTRALRDSLLEVFARLQDEAGGGNAHFLDWARDNPTEFYKLTLRILPRAAIIPERPEDPITEIRRIIVAPPQRDPSPGL
jgi:hypothetical protein